MTTPANWSKDNCLFVFGSLMDPEVLEIVSGLNPEHIETQAVTAQGYQQCEVAEESYPVLVANEHSTASGMVIRGLTTEALERILFFEGEEYFLAPISVSTATGDEIEAWFFKDTGVYTVRANPWNFDAWQAEHKAAFLTTSRQYMELFGTMTAAEADAHWVALTDENETPSADSVPAQMSCSPAAAG